MNFPHFSLGWLPDVPDARDVPFEALYKVPRKLPPKADLRAACSPVEDQEELGSCTAQALAGALEFLQLKALRGGVPPKFRDLSRLFIYYNSRAAMGTVREDSGAMLRVGIKTLAKLGACKESLWPYDIGWFARKPSARCYKEALGHTITSYQRLTSLAEMKACLAQGMPFVFGFSVYEHVMSPTVARTGVIRMPGPKERLQGGHAVLAVGYDDATERVLFRNSWGEGWGKKGYGELPYGYLTRRDLSDDFWCVQSTASDLYALRSQQETFAGEQSRLG
jgi:C1A family cysteine protease